MGIIKLKNIRTYSYHGCLQEEGIIGSDYAVDLEITADLAKSCISDDLHDTVDYVLLNTIDVDEMAIRSHLLEHVAHRIISKVFEDNIIYNVLVTSDVLDKLGNYNIKINKDIYIEKE